ncbi:hypothetical protein [Actinoplanes sp. NPDC049316]|uniref:hypothetical protein n=1 Tax=Actinoplanes sp. NPDC049316 TaxID=3154727 RepID=UPI0034419C92
MPTVGELVTVRALWPMPGVPDGAVSTLSWGPQLAALVDAGRYEVLPVPESPEPTGGDDMAPVGDGEPPAAGAALAPGEQAGERPGRRARGR